MRLSAKEQFMIQNKGKCATCEDHKYLDTMVRKDGKKGLYECIDCKTEKEASLTDYYKEILKLNDYDDVIIKAGKLKNLIKWVLG